MGDLDRRERLLPRLDAVEELPLMAGGNRQHHRQILLLFALLDFLDPVRVGRLELAAVDRDPAVGADPLRAALDIAMASRDDQLDLVGVLAVDAIFRGRVPDRVLRREVGGGGDFERPDLVVGPDAVLGIAQAPVGDVAMMADPVEELAAAKGVIPAPVLVEVAGVVGFEGAGPTQNS